MTTYFEAQSAKPALRSKEIFNGENSRPDLLLDQYRLMRARLMTEQMSIDIDDMYMRWCDLLFGGFNVVVLGAQSKFSLLETFKRRYLDSDRLPDFRTATSRRHANATPCSRTPTPQESVSKRKNPRTQTRPRRGAATPDSECQPDTDSPMPDINPEKCPILNVVTVRMHGLDPIKLEAFNHAIFGITESRRAKEADYITFIRSLKTDNLHFVFLIHSFEYFLRDCKDICETIFHLFTMDPIRVHLLMSSDVLNAGKKLHNLKIKLQLAFFVAPFTESFLWEKTELMNQFDERADGAESAHNETTVHRLFNDKTDLQSLMDIHQALDQATASVMQYIFKDYLDKCKANENQDDEDYVLPYALVDSDPDIEQQNRMQPKRQAKAQYVKQPMRSKKSIKSKKLGTHLDFHHLLNHCESKFIIRRGAALRNHLGELKDHLIIAIDESGNKIQCLVEARMCQKFLDWLETQQK